MTPAERASYLLYGPYVKHFDLCDRDDLDDLQDLIAKAIHRAVLDERKACAEIAHKVAMHYYAEHVDPDRVWGTGTEAYTACEEIEKAIKERT